MNLNIMTPGETFSEKDVAMITAESAGGFFGILPRHIDMVSALVPGILYYRSGNGGETYFAVDEGVLVKKGGEVDVSVRRAIKGGGLGTLKKTVGENMEALDEHEKRSRAILARLEADFIRRFMEIK